MAMVIHNNVLYPAYAQDFSCIGSACEDNCCGGWSISIDKATYMKYRQVKDPQLVRLMETGLKRNKPTGDEKGTDNADAQYATIKLKPDGQCPFFGQDKLCLIQKKLGPGYLSRTCNFYPRKAYSHDGTTIQVGMNASCPEVARKVLSIPGQLSFIQLPMNHPDVPGQIFGVCKNTWMFTSSPVNKAVAGHMNKLQFACIDIMQSQTHTLAERIFLVGLMLKAVDDTPQDERKTQIPKIIERYAAFALSPDFHGQMEDFSDNDALRGHMQGITSVHVTRLFSRNAPVANLVRRLAPDGVTRMPQQEMIDRARDLVRTQKDTTFLPFLKKYNQAVENFFVNYIYFARLPFAYFFEDTITLMNGYIPLVEQYALLRLLMCSNLEPNQEPDDALVTQIFTTLAHITENSNTPRLIKEVYTNAGLDSLAHMSFLLRDD